MENIQIIIGGKDLTFSVKIEGDPDHGAPWEDCDGHGPVTGWVHRDKLPGELVLKTDRNSKRYYDFAEACRVALRDGWDHTATKPETPETPRQKAARAARADFEFLRGWCNNEWGYVGVIVTLLNPDGTESDISESLWGVDTFDDAYPAEVARNLADDIAGGLGTRWGLQTREVYAMGEVTTEENEICEGAE